MRRGTVGTATILLPVVAALSLGAPARAQAGDCPDGTVKIGEKRTETADAIIVQPICRAGTLLAPPPPALDPASLRVINGMNALARQWGWSADKLARIDRNLRALDFGDSTATAGQIRDTWRDIRARGQDADLIREASRDGDLGFPGAGTQTSFNDCAIFALANATGRPYGYVAARATRLISQGSWRNPEEQAHPQAVIEKGGLNGGEVVMLAEIFGRAQVVSSTDFASVLREGIPVMARVAPGHEVVLTKTFQHEGQTWFAMMDSYQGPQRQLFLSTGELSTLLQENGVAYRATSRNTSRLLRNGGAQ